MIGIYKITSPNGRVYIGQSIDIEKRFRGYRTSGSKSQTLLHRSFIKYGSESHKFRVILECLKQDLNNLEAFYIKVYSSTDNSKGLNLREGGSVSRHSPETIERMKIAQKGKIVTQETRDKIRDANLGKKRPENEKVKISKSMKNVIKSDSHLQNIKDAIRSSETHKANLNAIHKAKRKKVACTVSGKVFDSVKQLASINKIPYSSLVNMLNGFRVNNTSYKYL